MLGNDGSAIGGLTAQLVTSVAHGTLTLAADGGVSYTPEAGFTGDDSFTYRTQSAGGLSVPATVTITVNEPTDVQAPQELRVSSIEGNVVTFRWKAPVGRPGSDRLRARGRRGPGADAGRPADRPRRRRSSP